MSNTFLEKQILGKELKYFAEKEIYSSWQTTDAEIFYAPHSIHKQFHEEALWINYLQFIQN